MHTSDVTFDFAEGKSDVTIHRTASEPWKVTIVDTGLNTMTGGRIKRVREYIEGERFFLTYGDGVADVNIKALLDFHLKHGKMLTITAYNPGQRFGAIEMSDAGKVSAFREKAKGDGALMNAGFMVCEPKFIDYIEGDSTVLERDPMEKAARDGQAMAYRHDGFWQCMDTVREKQALEAMWAKGEAPWKVW